VKEEKMPEPLIIIGIIAAIVAGVVIFIVKKKKKEDSGSTTVTIKPDTSGRASVKKALLVGINIYKPELDTNLRGCVNDVETMRKLLVDNFGFNPENIRVLVDERATKQGILDRLKWLLNGSKEGDELVFYYSGHGSQVRDRNGDELDDQLDEILCPHDLDWDDPLTDDILAALFKQLPEYVHLTMLCDSCHSGSISRSMSEIYRNTSKSITAPFDIRSRSYDKILPKNKMGKKNKGTQRHLLMSGCKDNQTSADAYIDGRYQGAFTWALTKTIRENPDINWQKAHEKTVELLSGYSQEPQLSGDASAIFRNVFGGK
jgi:hypothetical protein